MAPGGPLPGVVGTAYLGTACLYSQYAGYKVSVNEYYSGRPGLATNSILFSWLFVKKIIKTAWGANQWRMFFSFFRPSNTPVFVSDLWKTYFS